MTGLWLGLFFVGFAVGFWLLLCVASWTVDDVFELYPGAKRRRRQRQPPAPPERFATRSVTLCGCNDCYSKRRP